MRTGKHIVLCVCLGAFFIAGCEDEVASPTGVDGPFSVYGILNPRLNRQTLLVSPLETLLAEVPPDIDASVRSTDMNTGKVVAWRDSVVRNKLGQLDHVFYADFRPQYQGKYRVEVVRSDGAASEVVASTPGKIDITTGDDGTHDLRVRIEGEGFHLLSIETVYTVREYAVGIEPKDWCAAPSRTFTIDHTDDEVPVDGGYEILISLELEHFIVMREFSFDNWVPSVNGLALTGMWIRLVVADPAWDPPGGAFDANVLAQPGTMSNVTNGLGFVGGGYNRDASLYPSRRALDDTWFFDFLMRPPTDCFDYCSCGFAGE